MKRTIPFPSMPGRDASVFDPSNQANLRMLHHPKRLGRSLTYENVDPKALRRHVPCPQEYKKVNSERFPESLAIREEIREERIAIRDASTLEAFIERQQKRAEYSMTQSPKYHATSLKAVAEGARFSFPRASRGLGPPKKSEQVPNLAASQDGGHLTLDASFSKAVLPHIKGSVAMERSAMRNGRSPNRRAASSMDALPAASGAPGSCQGLEAPLRSESVPLGPSKTPRGPTLGDYLHDRVDEDQQSSATPQRTGRPAVVEDGDSHEGAQKIKGFFMTKQELFALRDLNAPDLKRQPARSHAVIGTCERQAYEYEKPHGDAYNDLDVIASEKAVRSRNVRGVVPFAKTGREPEQPPRISSSDPLIKASRRTQDDITDTICPDFKVYVGRKRAQLKIARERKAQLEKELQSQTGPTEKYARDKSESVDDQVHDEAAQRGVKGPREPKSMPQASLTSPTRSQPGPTRRRKTTKEPLYRVSHGGGRLEMNLDVLFRGKRFQELLAMHDFMVEREINGGQTEGERALYEAEAEEERERAAEDPSEPVVLSVAEKMRQGIPVTFEEALAETERREHLLQLRCLSLGKDGSSKDDFANAGKSRRATFSFGPGPERFAPMGASELQDKATNGLNQLKVEVRSPSTAMFRSHMKLKELYDKMRLDVDTLPDTKEGTHNASIRRLSMVQ